MYCINVEEQFHVPFMIKMPIFSPKAFNMFQARSVFEGTSYRLRVLAMLSFSVIICYSAIEIGLYLLYRKKVIAAIKLSKKSLGARTSFREKTIIGLSQPKPFRESHHFDCARAYERALMTRKSCTVGMRSANLRNNLKLIKKSVIVTLLIISALFTHFQLSF